MVENPKRSSYIYTNKKRNLQIRMCYGNGNWNNNCRIGEKMEKNEIIIVVILVVIFTLLISGFGMMGFSNYGGFNNYGMGSMMQGMFGYGFGFMWFFGLLFWILIVVAIVLFIIWLIKQLQEPRR